LGITLLKRRRGYDRIRILFSSVGYKNGGLAFSDAGGNIVSDRAAAGL
jgi:hypothetical protein